MSETKITQKDIDVLKTLYFSQPRILYEHLFSSYYQLVDEIIPAALADNNNYFYEHVDNNAIYLHGFKCKNISIKPPVNPMNNELLSPMEARKKLFKIFWNKLLQM